MYQRYTKAEYDKGIRHCVARNTVTGVMIPVYKVTWNSITQHLVCCNSGPLIAVKANGAADNWELVQATKVTRPFESESEDPVMLSTGEDAVILDIDTKNQRGRSVLAKIRYKDDSTEFMSFKIDGCLDCAELELLSFKLQALETKEHEAWVNLHPNGICASIYHEADARRTASPKTATLHVKWDNEGRWRLA
jgi:hypothetical protein